MALDDNVVVMYMASFPELTPRPAPALPYFPVPDANSTVTITTAPPFIPEDPKDKTLREILDELRLIRELLEHPPKSLTEKRMRQMVRGVLKKGDGKRKGKKG